MLNKKEYANGQKIFEIKENTLTYFFKNGNLKASGPYINELMEGEWVFYRESGQLWQTGNFQHNTFIALLRLGCGRVTHFTCAP